MEKVLRGRKSRCNLYSVGPSCGSGSNRVIPVSLKCRGNEETSGDVGRDSWSTVNPFPAVCVFALEDVDQGEETLGGFGSYVNMEAMFRII